MSGDHLQALQQAVYGVLHADATLMGLLDDHLYDRIPEGLDTTAITVLSFKDIASQRSHTIAQTVEKITMSLSCIGRTGSRKTVLDVVERVVILLDNAVLSLTGSAVQLISLRIDRVSVSPDKNGISHSGMVSVVGWVV